MKLPSKWECKLNSCEGEADTLLFEEDKAPKAMDMVNKNEKCRRFDFRRFLNLRIAQRYSPISARSILQLFRQSLYRLAAELAQPWPAEQKHLTRIIIKAVKKVSRKNVLFFVPQFIGLFIIFF